MAIRNAFQRASATIIDCNITHLIAGRGAGMPSRPSKSRALP